MSSTRIQDRSWFTPAMALVAIVLCSLMAIAMLGSQVSGVLSTVGAPIGQPPYGGGNTTDGNSAEGDTTGGDTTSGSGSGGVVTAVARDELLIIKTGTLTLEVAGIGAALTAATEAMDALGGYAGGSERSGAGEDARATITFRVPAARFDEAMNAVRGLADEILDERSTTEEVTSQVVDLGARIRNLQATERALQSIMDRATVVKDVLSVQAELTTVRGSIEQLTAQKTHLEEQAAFSTLTVTFVLQPSPVLAEQQDRFDPAAEVDAASASLVGVLQGLATAGIWFGIVWLPILVALAFVSVVVAMVARRMRRRSSWEPVGN